MYSLKKVLKENLYLLILLSLTFTLASCSDDDDPVIPHEDHYTANGAIIYDGTGATAVSIFKGVTKDTLHTEEGELSDHFKVKFYDENKKVKEPPTNKHMSMAYKIADTSIVSVWQHKGEEGSFEFHLKGKKAGKTTIEIFIKHEDHNDFRSGKIPVVVKEHEGGDHHGHHKIVGAVVYDAKGKIAASIIKGVTKDTLKATEGKLSDHFEVKFYDKDNKIVDVSDNNHLSLDFTIGNNSIFEIYQHEGEEGSFEFHLKGKKAGNSTLKLRIKHHDHYHFTSGGIPVKIVK